MTEIQLAKKFSIRDLLKRAWHITSHNLGKILLLELLFLFMFAIGTLLIYWLFPSDETASPLSQLLNLFFSQAWGTLLLLGITNLALKFSNFEQVKISDFFSNFNAFPTLFFASILVGLAILLGFLLLIIPAFFVLARLHLYNYMSVDQKAGIIESLKKSWNTVKGATWKVLGFFFVCALLNILGILFLGFGLLLTYPVTAIASALLYRTLWTQSNLTVLADETKE